MTENERLKFIDTIAEIAQLVAREHNFKILVSVCVGQACKETGFGASALMMKYNAPFGVQVGRAKYHFGKGWRDKAYNAKTKEFHNGDYQTQFTDFRAYDSLYDAVTDYYDLLCVASRYRKAVNDKDYKSCIRTIAGVGYATAEKNNHSYSNSVIQIIEHYNLTRFDTETIEQPHGKGLYTISDLNLRSSDSVTTDNKILVIPKGARVELRGFVPVKYNGVNGFVSSKYLEIKGD